MPNTEKTYLYRIEADRETVLKKKGEKTLVFYLANKLHLQILKKGVKSMYF